MERILALQNMPTAYAEDAFLVSSASNHCSSQSNNRMGCSSQSIECGGGTTPGEFTGLEW